MIFFGIFWNKRFALLIFGQFSTGLYFLLFLKSTWYIVVTSWGNSFQGMSEIFTPTGSLELGLLFTPTQASTSWLFLTLDSFEKSFPRPRPTLQRVCESTYYVNCSIGRRPLMPLSSSEQHQNFTKILTQFSLSLWFFLEFSGIKNLRIWYLDNFLEACISYFS